MKSLCDFLKEQGYDAECISYESTKYSMLDLADDVQKKVQKSITGKKYSKIHFVGFSLGGQIIRLLLSKYKYTNLGKLVLLASPCKGSEVASFFKNFWPYQVAFGPAGQELEYNMPKISKHFKKLKCDVGVLAGSGTIDPFSAYFILSGENDGKVTVESTKLPEMKDHMVLPVSHALFPCSELVHEQTFQFIKNGKFRR